MSDSYKDRHAKLGCMVLRLFPQVMQIILRQYITPLGLKRKYEKNEYRFVLRENEIALMDKLPNMDDFTTEICYKILRFENMIDEPKCKWGNVPHDDVEVEMTDDIQRIINATNLIVSIKPEEVTQNYSDKLLQNIELIVSRTDSFFKQDTLRSMYNTLSRSGIDTTSVLQDLSLIKAIEVTKFLPNSESKEHERYSRLSMAIIETFPKILRQVIKSRTSASHLYQMCEPYLKKFYPEQQTSLKELQNSNTYDSLDITLACRLLTQFSLIPSPTNGWGIFPDDADISLGADIERIRCYRNQLAHRRDTNIDKPEFDNYFNKFQDICRRIDLHFFQNSNYHDYHDYERRIIGHNKCAIDAETQIKYENAMKGIENIKFKCEKKPVKFYWGDTFETSLRNLRSHLKDEMLDGRQTVRLQIIFETEDDVEKNIDILNSFKDEINECLTGIEFIVATKGSIVLNADISLEMIKTDELLQSTVVLFLEKILERIKTFATESIEMVLIPIEEPTQWNKSKPMVNACYLNFDIQADLFETDIKMEEQMSKISEAISKYSNGSETNNKITATLLPISLVRDIESSNSSRCTATVTRELEYSSSPSLELKHLRYQMPYQSAIANAEHCYSQKLTSTRYISADTSGQTQGSVAKVSSKLPIRPMSAPNARSVLMKTEKVPTVVSSTEKIEKIENVVKTSESFAEKYQSAMDKTYDDSKSLFKNDDINSYDHEVLSTVLINAEKTEDKVIQDPDLSRILQDSSMIKKQFCELFSDILADANVWIGVKCTCDTTIHNQYEGVPCRKGDCTIVIEKDGLATSDSVFPNQFLGLKTLYVNTTASHDYETATIAEKMMECPWRSPNKVPGTVAKELFKQHSNLTMVCPSNFKSTGFNSKNAELHGINCIQLFCKIKGIIPIGESHFPSTIDGVTTDVLEGTSQFSSVVHIGDKIYNEQNNIGTLGGFVKYYGIDTFLTCSHVIFGKNDFFKLQNKDIHFKCHTISNKDVPEPVECVLIRHSLKYDQQEKDMQVDAKTAHRSNLQDNPDETSIDAALLLIETPNKTKSSVSRNLLTSRSASAVAGTSRSKTNVAELTIKLYGGIDSTQSSFLEYGLDSIYLNDNVLDPEGITSRALSLSAFSGKQEKHVTIHKEKQILIPIPAHVRTRDNIIMYNQISLRNMEFQDGDSGTCIYGKCLKSGKKGCIGMFIGKSTSGQYIVTPMKDILDSLGIKNMP